MRRRWCVAKDSRAADRLHGSAPLPVTITRARVAQDFGGVLFYCRSLNSFLDLKYILPVRR